MENVASLGLEQTSSTDFTAHMMKSECTVTCISNANSLRLPWSIQPTKTSFPLYVDNSIMYQPAAWTAGWMRRPRLPAYFQARFSFCNEEWTNAEQLTKLGRFPNIKQIKVNKLHFLVSLKTSVHLTNLPLTGDRNVFVRV